MSHSIPASTRNGASSSLAAAISSRLPADVVGGEAANRADRRRVIADRDVVVAAFARRAGHLLDGRSAVRPGCVAVQIPADIGELEQRRRHALERLLAKLGRQPRYPERPVHRLLVGALGEWLERVDVRPRTGRPEQRGSEPFGLGGDELDRHSLERDPDRVGGHRAPAAPRSAAAGRTGRARAAGRARR